MEWETIDTFLGNLAALLGLKMDQLKLDVANDWLQDRTATIDQTNIWRCIPSSSKSVRYTVLVQLPEEKHRRMITAFVLTPMPGCCAFVVSHSAYVSTYYRNKGVQTEANLFRQACAKAGGFPFMLCTDVDTNTPQQRVLVKNGWQHLTSVFNTRTNRNVFLSMKEIK